MLRFICSFFLVLVGSLIFGRVAFALTISPPVLEYTGKPGDALINAVRVYNDESKAVTVYISVVNAVDSGDEQGTPRFYSANEDIGGQSLAKWLAYEHEPFTLKPGESFSHPFTINVPQNAQPGGHFGAIVYSTTPQGKKTVTIGSQLAALLLVNVEGETKESAYIASIDPTEKKRWYSTLPSGFNVRVENSGTTYIKPVGGVAITNMLGITTEYIPVNRDGGNVLPQTIRRFDVRGPGEVVTEEKGIVAGISREVKNFGFGVYKAKVALGYGSAGQTIEGEYTFFVIPWRLLGISLGALFVIWVLSRVLKWLARKPRLEAL